MSGVEYRLFLGNRSARRDDLDRFEEIVVEQVVDRYWEAQMNVPLCTDDHGNWTGETERFLGSFQRVRVEVKTTNGGFVPLIDGPIVERTSQLTGEPGRSVANLTVRDDSIYWNRNELVRRYNSIEDLVLDLMHQPSQIGRVDIDADLGGPPSDVVQRGTAIQILRELARNLDKHIYALPGDQPGQSIGVFKAFPTRKDGLPDLQLMGEQRNVDSLRISYNATAAGSRRGSTINLTDRGLVQASASLSDVQLLGADPPVDDQNAATRLLRPGEVRRVGPNAAANAQAARDAWSFESEGHIVSDCYTAVLSPYRLVTLAGVNGRLSGNHVITAVTHTLNRNIYGQRFKLLRNSQSAGAGTASALPRIF